MGQDMEEGIHLLRGGLLQRGHLYLRWLHSSQQMHLEMLRSNC